MRVLLDCRMATWGGIGRYAHGLVRALAEEPGLEIVQMTAHGETPPVREAETVEASAHPFSLRGALEFGAIARSAQPDVTHALHFPVPLPAAHPLVVSIQDLTPLLIQGVMPSALRRAVYRASLARAARVADLVLTPSACSTSDVARMFPAAAPRTRTVPLAADDFTSGEVGELPEWVEGRRYVLSMGNTKPHKDLPTLLRAFDALADQSLLLVLAGTCPRGFVGSVLGGAPAAARVRFTGRADDATLRALYRSAALFVFPSRYEGFGLPPLEAMSLGAPVVVAEAGSLPEVVGEAALLVPPGDALSLAEAMQRVLTDESLAVEMRSRGLAQAAVFSWVRTARETADAYRAIAAGS
ncbi:MAG: glycosyltransferase family 4 protein [Coriobacteriia bacterium]